MTRLCIIAGKVIRGLKISNKELSIWHRHLARFSNTRRRKRFKELGHRSARKLVKIEPDGVYTNDPQALKDFKDFGVNLYTPQDIWLSRYRYLPLVLPLYRLYDFRNYIV